jgi:hypothetical protein
VLKKHGTLLRSHTVSVHGSEKGSFFARARISLPGQILISVSNGRRLAKLHRLGIATLLFTGDSAEIATGVGARLHVGRVRAELPPQDKLREIERLRSEGRKVAMMVPWLSTVPLENL